MPLENPLISVCLPVIFSYHGQSLKEGTLGTRLMRQLRYIVYYTKFKSHFTCGETKMLHCFIMILPRLQAFKFMQKNQNFFDVSISELDLVLRKFLSSSKRTIESDVFILPSFFFMTHSQL